MAAEGRRATRQAALDAEAARRAPMAALDQCVKSADYIARQLGDPEAGTVLCAAMGTLAHADAAEREAWAAGHAGLLIATADWSWEVDKPGQAYSSLRRRPRSWRAGERTGPRRGVASLVRCWASRRHKDPAIPSCAGSPRSWLPATWSGPGC